MQEPVMRRIAESFTSLVIDVKAETSDDDDVEDVSYAPAVERRASGNTKECANEEQMELNTTKLAVLFNEERKDYPTSKVNDGQKSALPACEDQVTRSSMSGSPYHQEKHVSTNNVGVVRRRRERMLPGRVYDGMGGMYPSNGRMYGGSGRPYYGKGRYNNEIGSMSNSEGACMRVTFDQNEKFNLSNNWSIWYYESNSKKNWEKNLIPISSFNTVIDFWATYNFLKPPGQLRDGCDYAFFKYGVKPMWEDPTNLSGGRWLLNIPKRHRETRYLDVLWLETLMCLVGEAFEEQSDQVCGTVITLRPKLDRIALWTKDSNQANANVKIAQKWKERMRIPSAHPLAYEAHIDNKAKAEGHCPAKVLYTA